MRGIPVLLGLFCAAALAVTYFRPSAPRVQPQRVEAGATLCAAIRGVALTSPELRLTSPECFRD